MADKNNATCSICGSGYYACLSCHDSMKLQPWKIHCCSASHFKVFQVVRGLSTGVYTNEEARDKLKNIDLNDINTFRPHIKSIVKDVLKEPVKVVKEMKPIENVVVDEKVELTTNDINSENEKDISLEKKVAISYKKNYKTEIE